MSKDVVSLLLVEDEPDLKEALGEYLEACGFQVTAVSTAAEALSLASSLAPRLVLTDLTLPDRRGDHFLEEFHSLVPGCLLYVHSGDSTFTAPKVLQQCGLSQDHVFSKPADLSAMVAKFRTDLSAG